MIRMVHLSKKTLTVYLDPDMLDRIEALVARGLYPNSSAVAAEAFSLLESELKQRAFEQQLRRAYEVCQAANIPPARSMTAFLETLGDNA
ncbi:ribbon-helix-helix domain-containing protein [Rhizobium halophytocola]|uniref:Arc/MetJ-type ribon-helix-helix transcriptional regulator n=1 Tax=Rhizobium halophytocola TaxID=735519 RepID=A0ABS4DZ41_9HYPH|nr:hypothetical protein [Rhizobium halophytocola]MBP1850960.1 Arc/MetJ-type ribon-helix-helix transcriptional regulator [Rhizobium halophytocola]